MNWILLKNCEALVRHKSFQILPLKVGFQPISCHWSLFFLYILKTLAFYVFRGYRKGPVAWNGLSNVLFSLFLKTNEILLSLYMRKIFNKTFSRNVVGESSIWEILIISAFLKIPQKSEEIFKFAMKKVPDIRKHIFSSSLVYISSYIFHRWDQS